VHSSKLRGSDFQLTSSGNPVDHAVFFADFKKTDRIGVFTPKRYEAAGAVTLVMAYVTAFYDQYRAESHDFFAYPDFFTFQKTHAVAKYGMFDIWPAHKNVHVPSTANETAAAITDRGINILLLPDKPPCDHAFEPVQTESIRRNIRRCFIYSETGALQNPTLEITTKVAPFKGWVIKMFDSVPEDETLQQQKKCWLKTVNSNTLKQSFKEIPLADAIKRL